RSGEPKRSTDFNVNTCGDGRKLGIVPIVCSLGKRSKKINALVDEGSDSTIIAEWVVKRLQIPKSKMRNLTMNLLSKEVKCKSGIVVFDIAGPGFENHRLQALTLPDVCQNLSAFPWSSVQARYEHLSDLPLLNFDGPVDMLIGVDQIDLITPVEIRRGRRGEPVAMRCALVWVVRGRTFETEPSVGASDAIAKFRKESGGAELKGHEIIKRAQKESFGEELDALITGRKLKKTSRLAGLNPTIDPSGLIRVGGRIDRAKAPYDLRHPVVLEPSHPLTHLILNKIHFEGNHGGTNHVLSILRQHYHVLRGREAVKRTKTRCSFCRKRDARPLDQIMADLPNERFEIHAPPFSRISVDCFGPYVPKSAEKDKHDYEHDNSNPSGELAPRSRVPVVTTPWTWSICVDFDGVCHSLGGCVG
ncbi:hypothetical protein TCAL_10562, partial [Tigriopus californicus]